MHSRWGVGRATALRIVAVLTAVAVCAGACGERSTWSVSYERSGGIAGEHTRLTITPAGTATVTSRAGARHAAWTRPLPADEWRALRSALDAAGFDTLAARYRAPGTCNDCFVDTVRYRDRTVTVEGAAAPGRLSDALRLLASLAARK